MPANRLMTKKGYLPDYFDARDKSFDLVRDRFSSIASDIVDEYHVPQNGLEIFNQDVMSSCVANAWVRLLMLLLYMEWKSNNAAGPAPELLSRMFLYYTARAATGDQKRDGGTFLRSGAKQLTTVGVCPEKLWPYTLSNLYKSPPLEALNVASDNQISAYYRIDSTGKQRLDDIELALRANHPAVFGTQVGEEMEKYTGAATVLTIPLQNLGGHALCCTGFRRHSDGRRDFLIDNSWSTQWGLNGRAWLDENYMMWTLTQDIWVGTRAPALVI
jgi:C1A family cysteine protease